MLVGQCGDAASCGSLTEVLALSNPPASCRLLARLVWALVFLYECGPPGRRGGAIPPASCRLPHGAATARGGGRPARLASIGEIARTRLVPDRANASPHPCGLGWSQFESCARIAQAQQLKQAVHGRTAQRLPRRAVREAARRRRLSASPCSPEGCTQIETDPSSRPSRSRQEAGVYEHARTSLHEPQDAASKHGRSNVKGAPSRHQDPGQDPGRDLPRLRQPVRMGRSTARSMTTEGAS